MHNFIQKKSTAEALIILVEIYGDDALLETACRDWFRRFKNIRTHCIYIYTHTLYTHTHIYMRVKR